MLLSNILSYPISLQPWDPFRLSLRVPDSDGRKNYPSPPWSLCFFERLAPPQPHETTFGFGEHYIPGPSKRWFLDTP